MTNRKAYIGPLTDSRRWDHFKARADDVFVVTPPKCGTTWTQTIVALLFSGDPEVETELSVKMPWLDIRIREIEGVADRLEAMTHRRSVKSHTPMDGLPYSAVGQYICVFRHPLDAHFSFRKHMKNVPFGNIDLFFPEGDDDTTYRRFMDGASEGHDTDAMPLAHILQHYKAAVALAEQPNVTLLHYADMTRDLPGTFAKLADVMGISHSPSVMDDLIRAATFDNMKTNAEMFAPSGGKGFFTSDSEFFQSGTSVKWVGKLTKSQIAQYDAAMDLALEPAARAWLEHGDLGIPAGD